jgi:FlaA1/EpsC-like NDP-sugar epimerase
MRFRLFGQFVHASIAALAAVEAAAFVGTVYLAYRIRLGTWYPTAPDSARDVLWPCAAVFSVAVVVSLLAFGLYSSRQRARIAGLSVRLIAATAAATVVTAAAFYVVPSMRIGRGVLGLAALLALGTTLVSRLLFTRIVDESLFKRRVLVYGVGQHTIAMSRLRRRADRRGFEIVGFLQPGGEDVCVPAERVLGSEADLLRLCDRYEVSRSGNCSSAASAASRSPSCSLFSNARRDECASTC